jgi:formylglycine-generating enzyme required for sulfatase activity
MIPAGPFLMGNDFGSSEVQPAHYLTLPAYQIARYPVTNLEYATYLIATNRKPPARWPRAVRWLEDASLPACVSWSEAVMYCVWLATYTRAKVRLPTEAEWEKAATWNAALGTKTLYPWGNDFDPAYCNTAEAHLEALTPIDMYRLVGDSAYGVSDMIGNAAEWTLARKMPYPYSPEGGRHDLNIVEARVARGGSYLSPGKRVTAVYRQYLAPDEVRIPVGVRIVIGE